MDMEKAIKETHAYRCLDCGKCTAVCPLARLNPLYSPRLTVERALWGGDLAHDRLLWSCLTCEACSERCQSDVAYSEFIRHLRTQAWKDGQSGECAHGGALQTLMRMMTKELKQNRLGWLRRGLKVAERSDTLYFVGCLPYFEVIFQEFGFPAHKIARSTVKALNRLGITPMVLEDERCCGHDLLWEGDVDDFRRLAELNLQTIEESGAQRVVTSCAECYHTLAVEYPRYVGGPKAEVIHISELLAQELPTAKASRRPTKRVTYQDPCRLGRFSGLYEPPRQVIASLPAVELVEMERNRAQALCCGTSCWTNCGADNKEIQVERLREAKATGADLLITACPKCQIHFRCAMSDKKVGQEARIEVVDLVVLAANAL